MKEDRDRELLFSIGKNDFDINWFSGTGKGGQKRNKTQACCRLTHRDSGVTKTGQNHRERSKNLSDAFNNLISDFNFKMWFRRRVEESMHGKIIEEKVNLMMDESNLKIETFKDGKWIELNE